jgi:phosphoribosylformylglycinamidine synthase subunit PurS
MSRSERGWSASERSRDAPRPRPLRGSRPAIVKARVLIRPKAGILDPQGATVERALPTLGFGGVANVHVGRLVELDVEDPGQLERMCELLLANPLVEEYEIQILNGRAG